MASEPCKRGVSAPGAGMSRDSLLDPLAQGVGIQRPSHPVAFFCPLHQNQGRNATDSELLLEGRRQVCVDLDPLQLACPLLGQPLHGWGDDPAWGAPGSPEVDQHRDRALLDDSAEIRRAGLGQPWQRMAAFRAVRHSLSGRTDSCFLTARGAGDDLGLAHLSVATSPIWRWLKRCTFPCTSGSDCLLYTSPS